MSVVSRGRADRVRIGFVCVCVVRRCTKYRSGYSEAAAPVKFFWRVLESYDDEMQVRHCVPLRSTVFRRLSLPLTAVLLRYKTLKPSREGAIYRSMRRRHMQLQPALNHRTACSCILSVIAWPTATMHVMEDLSCNCKLTRSCTVR